MKLTIKITKDILERSKLCGLDNKLIGKNCAIACAVRDIFPYTEVTDTKIFLFDREIPDDEYRPNEAICKIPLPKEATEFIVEFDNTSSRNRPFMNSVEFDIEIPDEIIEKIVDIEDIKTIIVETPHLFLN
jgi:hypothetical protein